MPDRLTPQERQRIYLEEKARMEIREELQPKRRGVVKTTLSVLGILFAVVVVLSVIGAGMEDSRTAEFNALSPDQKHAEMVKSCAELRRSLAFKTYAERTVEERRLAYSCALLQ